MNTIEVTCSYDGSGGTGPVGGGGSRGVPTGPYVYWVVAVLGELDSECPELAAKVAEGIERWRERQRLAEQWRAAAEASGVLDSIREDPLLDDYNEQG